MDSEIPERLRKCTTYWPALLEQAADEIERLRSEVDRLDELVFAYESVRAPKRSPLPGEIQDDEVLPY